MVRVNDRVELLKAHLALPRSAGNTLLWRHSITASICFPGMLRGHRGDSLSSIAMPALWILFGVVVSGLLARDLFLCHGRKRPLGASEALLWSLVWIAVALLFNGLVYFQFGTWS